MNSDIVVLVTDKPKSCYDCKFSVKREANIGNYYACLCNNKEIADVNIIDENCPLKELPKAKDYPGTYAQGYSEYEARYCEGYNDCLDDILEGK